MFSSFVRHTVHWVRTLVIFVAGVLAGLLYLPKVRSIPMPAAQAAATPDKPLTTTTWGVSSSAAGGATVCSSGSLTSRVYPEPCR